jgi:hypothetical protein
MSKADRQIFVPLVLSLLLSSGLATSAFAQQSAVGVQSTYFTPGNLVVSVEGCGVVGGTCAGVPGGTGTGAGTSSVGGYGDNQAAPMTLFQYTPAGAYVNSLVLPQAASGANFPVSGEYGSQSEGSVQLDGTGRYLTIMGYGVGASEFNTNSAVYGPEDAGQLAQSSSLTGQSYTPVPRVVATIDAYGNVNSSTATYNVFDTNNPRSAYSVDGFNFYISGQGGNDLTGGVFLTTFGEVNDIPTTITGADGETTPPTSQDTRTVQIYPTSGPTSTLYVSMDSKQGNDNRAYVGTLGTPPSTTVFVPAGAEIPTGYTTGPGLLPGLGNTGGTGRVKLTAAETNGINTAGEYINISPENFFFASPTVLYIADSGSPKNTSAAKEAPAANSSCGAGGLQKWVNESGTWTWVYTLYKGLNLVANLNKGCSTNTDGTTGLIGLTGVVNGATATLYATNYAMNDLDPTYIFSITDTISATANPGTTFTQLATAPADSNFKGISIAPTLPAGSATITSSPSGLAVTTSGTGCVPGTYTTPVTLIWTPGSGCALSVASPQSASGTQYVFNEWQDGTTVATDSVTAPSNSAVYSASFKTVPTVTWPTASAITYGQTLASSTLSGGSASVTGGFAFTTLSTIPGAGTAAQSVTFTPGDTTDYATVTGTVNVQVNPATLTVTANNASMAVGAAVPALTASYSGFVNGDGTGVLSGSPSLTTTATSSSPAGVYPITAAQGALSAANYSFTFVNGTLSVIAAPTIVLTTTATLSGSATSGYTASVTVTNSGTGAASNVVLTTATLGSATGSVLPQTLGTIAANGGSATVTVTFPGSAGANGARVVEDFAGTYTGGTFGGGIRAVLP